jgi:polyisoprenyl-teichoic acid--peptidoglycan teichoic acid transferase
MHRRIHRFFLPKLKITFLSIILICIGVCVLFFVSKTLTTLGRYGFTFTSMYKIIFSHGVTLDSTNGRTNVLLLGTGGNGHEGGDLTDSMLIMSLGDTDRSMALVSIPRDVWSDTLRDKVNSAYHYGEAKTPGGGLPLARAIAEEITGIPIHYSLIFDFSVFSDAVDFVGGIDVHVLSPFTDTEYPIAGKENDTCNGDPNVLCRYKTVSFDLGVTHMDGVRALEYVRSRHAEGTEGTDFARSRRQQEVLLAIRLKAMNPVNWFGMIGRLQMLKTINGKTKTDMTAPEMLTYGKILQSVDTKSIEKIGIDELFINPPEEAYDGKYVLIPLKDFDTVHTFISGALNK